MRKKSPLLKRELSLPKSNASQEGLNLNAPARTQAASDRIPCKTAPHQLDHQISLNRSVQAMQILQHTLQTQRSVGKSVEEFRPSPHLQDLFERCLEVDDTNSTTSSSSSVDYDALAYCLDDAGIFESLCEHWTTGESSTGQGGVPLVRGKDNIAESPDDSDLGINYDDLVDSD